MNDTFAALRQRLDSWPLIIVFGAIYFISQAIIGVIVHPLGADMLGVQTTLSAEEVRSIFTKWEAAGLIDVYAAHYRFDMIHPLWYSVFLATSMAKAFNANAVPAYRNPLLILPFVAGACDVAENFAHLTFLADRANITEPAVLFGNGAALIKWAIVLGCVSAIGALMVRAKLRKV